MTKYIVLEWEILDYAGGRNSRAYTFESKRGLLDFLERRSDFEDLDVYDVKQLIPEKVSVKLKLRKI